MNDKSTEPRAPKRAARRRAAEYVSLSVSILLIASVAAYLIYQGLGSDSPFVPAQAQPQLDQTRLVGDRYILPVLVRNDGHHTMRDVTVRISYTTKSGERQTQDCTLDYVGDKSQRTIYVYFDTDPRTQQIEAKLVQYRLD